MEANSTRAIGALLFMTGAMWSIDIFSAVNSSPWTAESFGGDPEKEKSARQYVALAIVMGEGFGAASSVIAGNWWPFVGVTVINMVMWFIYARALRRAKDSGSKDWNDGGGTDYAI